VVGGNEEQIKAIAQATVAEALAQSDPDVAGVAPPAMEPAAPAMEPAAPAMEPAAPAMEPAAPSAEMQALLRGQQRLSDAIEQLVKISMTPRKRTAVRDPKTRELLHVTESMDDETPETLQ
jgi:hypothetical protein